MKGATVLKAVGGNDKVSNWEYGADALDLSGARLTFDRLRITDSCRDTIIGIAKASGGMGETITLLGVRQFDDHRR